MQASGLITSELHVPSEKTCNHGSPTSRQFCKLTQHPRSPVRAHSSQYECTKALGHSLAWLDVQIWARNQRQDQWVTSSRSHSWLAGELGPQSRLPNSLAAALSHPLISLQFNCNWRFQGSPLERLSNLPQPSFPSCRKSPSLRSPFQWAVN